MELDGFVDSKESQGDVDLGSQTFQPQPSREPNIEIILGYQPKSTPFACIELRTWNSPSSPGGQTFESCLPVTRRDRVLRIQAILLITQRRVEAEWVTAAVFPGL
jgi:hypothetical protein